MKQRTSKELRTKRYRLKRISKKQQRVKNEYTGVCKAIFDSAIQEHGGVYCTSCHILVSTPNTVLRCWGNSHLLPKGMYPQYATDIWNISPRCQDFGYREGCHNALDNRDFNKIKEFKDLDNIMELLAKFEPTVYNQFVTGLKEVGYKKYDYVDLDF